MAKNKRRNFTEELEDEDYSTEDMETHRPNRNEKDLELDDTAYTLLEYLNLEWPAQSIFIENSTIYLGTNPHESAVPELLAIDIENTNYRNVKFKDKKINQLVNKIRLGSHIYAISDRKLAMYKADSLELVGEVSGRFGYGLEVTSDAVYAGEEDGHLIKYTPDLKQLEKWKVHNASIEAIGIADGCVFTGSVDCTLKVSDFNGQIVKELKNHSDINCLDVRDGKLIYGDEDGVVKLVDVKNFEEEEMQWHTTPISSVRWKDSDIFASCSEEQVCLWDKSFVEEWNFHKYLLFVHQGQQLYKDVAFDGDRVVTTSIDGLCIFTPISFAEIEE